MEVTIALVVYAVTLIAGEITKATPIPNKYSPLQNLAIALLSFIICIAFGVESLNVLETFLSCVFASMGAGGTADLKKVTKNK